MLRFKSVVFHSSSVQFLDRPVNFFFYQWYSYCLVIIALHIHRYDQYNTENTYETDDLVGWCTYFPFLYSIPVIKRHLFIILVPQHPKLCQLKGSHCNVYGFSELAPFHLSLRDFDRVLENDPTNHRIAWRGCQGASVGEVVSWRELLFLQYINIWMQYNTKTNEYCTYHPWSLWWYPQAAVVNSWNVNNQTLIQSKKIQ